MRPIWLALLALVALNTVLLSGCPITPSPDRVDHGGSGYWTAGTRELPRLADSDVKPRRNRHATDLDKRSDDP